MSVSLTESTSAQFTQADAVLAAGAIGQESDTGKVKIGDGTTAWTDLAYFAGDDRLEQLVGLATAAEAIAASSGGSSSFPIANADGVTIDAIVDPVTGGTMSVVTFADDQAAIAYRVAGNEFPTYLFTSDGGDGIYIGDGTFDPYNDDGANLFYSGGMQFGASKSGDTMEFNADSDVRFVTRDGNIVLKGQAPDTGGTVISTATLQIDNLPTSDPTVAGQLWNSAGTLKVSAG